METLGRINNPKPHAQYLKEKLPKNRKNKRVGLKSLDYDRILSLIQPTADCTMVNRRKAHRISSKIN